MRAKHRAVSGGLTFRLTLILLIVAALGMTVMGLYITRVLETYSTENFKSDLVKEARLIQDDIASALMKDTRLEAGQALAERYGGKLKVRVTIIAPNGTVVGDSEHTSQEVLMMENHASRPEVASALAGLVGSDLRRSRTLNAAMCLLGCTSTIPAFLWPATGSPICIPPSKRSWEFLLSRSMWNDRKLIVC